MQPNNCLGMGKAEHMVSVGKDKEGGWNDKEGAKSEKKKGSTKNEKNKRKKEKKIILLCIFI